MARSVGVVFIDSRADGIFAVALVGHRSHCNVHLLSIAAEDDSTRAVAPRGKIYKLFRRPLGLSIAILILVSNDAVRSSEIQIAVVNCHPEHARSEERRVGKECRSPAPPDHSRKTDKT